MEQTSLNNNYSNILNAVMPMMMQPFKFTYMAKESTLPTKQNMRDALSEALLDTIKNISPKPKWLDLTTTTKQWKKFIDEYVGGSQSVMTAMKEIHDVYSDSSNNQFELFIRACRQIQEHFNKSYYIWQESSMSEFLNSDLPFTLYTTYTMSHISKMVAVKQMEKIAKSFQSSMITTGNNYNHHILDSYRNEIARINEQIALSIKSELALRLFLKCLSESKIQDLFDGDNKLTMGGYVEEFNKRFADLKQSVFNLMQVLNVDPSAYTMAVGGDAATIKKFQNLLSGYEWWNNDTKSS